MHSQAAKEKGVWGIGVDTDQAFLGPHVLTSALKLVDLGVFRMIRDVKEGNFVGGADSLYTVKNGGVGFGKVSVEGDESQGDHRQADCRLEADRSGQDQAAEEVAARSRSIETEGGPIGPPSVVLRHGTATCQSHSARSP